MYSILKATIFLLLTVAAMAGCSQRAAKETSSPPESATNESKPKHPRGEDHMQGHPPIDCPLHKAGIDASKMKPFEETEKYIAFLERPDRAKWQKPDEVVNALNLSGDETVVDVGAGSGYFSFRFAEKLKQGKVVAVDIEPEMIRHIHHKAMTTGVENITASLTKPDDPGVIESADLVFICDVLHHVQDRVAWLKRIADTVKPGARLILIEFKEGDLPQGPPTSMKIPKKDLMELAKKAGFSFVREHKDLLPYQVFLEFRKEK